MSFVPLLRSPDDAEADVVKTAHWKIEAPHRRTAILFLIEPATAPIDAVGPGLGTPRIHRRTLRVIIRRVPILHPFTDVAAHVVKAPRIWLFLSGRMRLLRGVVLIPGRCIGHRFRAGLPDFTGVFPL